MWQDKPPALATIATGEGFPATSKQLVEKIQAGVSEDFAELPPANGIMKVCPAHWKARYWSYRLLISWVLGNSSLTWPGGFRALSVNMTVAPAKNPEQTKNMLAYLTPIAKSSLKYRWTSWVVYNQNFWEQVAEVGVKDWSKVHPSIYAQCFKGASVSP